MRRNKLVLMAAAVVVAALTGVPDAGATTNAPPGTMVLRGPSGEGGTRAADINNAYVVIGTYGGTPVRWDSIGRITVLPVPPGVSTFYMREITDSGFIIGDGYRDGQDGGRLGGALLWDPRGNLIELRPLPGNPQTHATDVNGSGVVVGSATAADGRQHAVRWDPQGRITELPVSRNGNFSYAAAINDQGMVAGHSDVVVAGTHVTHAVTWDAAGRMLDLGGWRSTADSQATAINNAGMVVGVRGASAVRWNRFGHITVLQPSGQPTAVNDDGVVISQVGLIRWNRQGQGIQLGGLGYPTQANAINSAGTIVGTSEAHSVHPGSWGFSRAAKWDPAGNVTDLGNAVGALNQATGINDKGAICGTSWDLNGPAEYAVVWQRWTHTGQPG